MLLWELTKMIPMKHFRERLSWSSGIIHIYWLLLQPWGACWWEQSPPGPPPFTELLHANEWESVSLKAVQQQDDQMFDVLSPEAPCFNRETSLIGLNCLKETGLSNWRRVNLVRRNNQFMSLRQKTWTPTLMLYSATCGTVTSDDRVQVTSTTHIKSHMKIWK